MSQCNPNSLSLFDQVCSLVLLQQGFSHVWRNKGAPGVDGVTVEEFMNKLEEELGQLSKDLQDWTYKPSPVRRVEIPKPNGGVRLLGIPCVRDRVVQATIKLVLESIFEARFSESSYGFRPGRSQEQAVKSAQEIVRSGKEYVVDIDLEKFFDRIHHDRLIGAIRKVVPDSKLLRLIGTTLRSGVMANGVVSPLSEGAPQGSPLSPLLSNIVLDELDKELERKGLKFCRFADDCNIFVGSQKAAERIMRNVTKFIEKRMKLTVNKEKSQVALSKFVKFLGMTIVAGALAISAKSMSKAMDKVTELVRTRGTHQSIERTVAEVNSWYRGWASYYKMTQYPWQLSAIEAHVRRRLRARIIGESKRRSTLYKKVVARGVHKNVAKMVYGNRGRWALSFSKVMHLAYPNAWFIGTLGQHVMSNRKLEHWFGETKRITLT